MWKDIRELCVCVHWGVSSLDAAAAVEVMLFDFSSDYVFSRRRYNYRPLSFEFTIAPHKNQTLQRRRRITDSIILLRIINNPIKIEDWSTLNIFLFSNNLLRSMKRKYILICKMYSLKVGADRHF
jgi:hypothetical protein